MHRRRLLLFGFPAAAALATAALAAPLPARAQVSVRVTRPGAPVTVIRYDDRADFQAALAADTAVTATTTATFNGVVPAGQASLGESSLYNAPGGAQFQTLPGAALSIDSARLGAGYDFGTGEVLSATDAAGDNAPLIVSLPAGTVAVGFDLGDAYGDSFVVTLSSGQEYVVAGGRSARRGGRGFGFIGLVFSAPVATVVVVGPGNDSHAVYDNFTTAQIALPAAPDGSGGVPPTVA